ncbi:MAG: hypothetical protein O7G87_07300, partial [bacterium]|nr:hypothetical protein [bacterium]
EPLKEGRRTGVAAANLGAIHAFYGRLDEATGWQDRAMGFFETAGDKEMLGKLAVARAVTAYIGSRQFGNAEPDDAIAHMETARSLLGDQAILHCEFELLLRSNQGDRAQSGYVKYKGLIRACEAQGDSLTLAHCAARVGWLEGSSGGHDSAAQLYGRAYRIYTSNGLEDAALLAQRNIGIGQWKSGEPEAAIATLNAALKKAQSANDLRMRLMLSNDLAMVSAVAKAEDQAIAYDRQADAALEALSRALESDLLKDSVVFDFTLLLKMRYTGKATYVVDQFDGFYEYLALIPEGNP